MVKGESDIWDVFFYNTAAPGLSPNFGLILSGGEGYIFIGESAVSRVRTGQQRQS